MKQEHEPQLKSSSMTKLKTLTQISFTASQSMRKYNAFYPSGITFIQKKQLRITTKQQRTNFLITQFDQSRVPGREYATPLVFLFLDITG